MRSTVGILWVVLALLQTGCPGPAYRVKRPPCAPGACKGVVFGVDGAGGFFASSTAIYESVKRTGAPLCVQTFEWTLGYGRVVADHVNQMNAKAHAKKLAELILTHKARAPHTPIYLTGHSAGSAIVVYATRYLPPDTVEKVILMAPSVSASCDIRPTMRCARSGVDVFYSTVDRFYLGVATAVFGTSDNNGYIAAGRTGFRPIIGSPEDGLLYQNRLRQHNWDCSVAWTGNEGGHFGTYQPKFLDAYVIPLLTPGPANVGNVGHR